MSWQHLFFLFVILLFSSVAEFMLEKNKLSVWDELSDNSSRYKSKFRLRLIRVSARLMDALRDG